MVNLQEVLDAMDVFRKVTGLRLVVTFRGSVRCAGLHLKRSAQEGYGATLPDVYISVFSEVVLLRDFLEDTSVALEKGLRGIYAFATRNALLWKFHVKY